MGIKRTCGNCVYFTDQKATDSELAIRGACHRYPPSMRYIGGNNRIEIIYTPVYNEDWCGEFTYSDVEDNEELLDDN